MYSRLKCGYTLKCLLVEANVYLVEHSNSKYESMYLDTSFIRGTKFHHDTKKIFEATLGSKNDEYEFPTMTPYRSSLLSYNR